jgi:signal transduction histidine kinase
VVTLLALAAVVAVTGLTIGELLHRRADRSLRDIADRVAALIERQDAASIGASWIEYEIDETRPVAMRVEVRDHTGRLLTAAGPALELPPAEPGCSAREATRMCTVTVGALLVSAATSEVDELATRNAFLVAMLIVTILSGVIIMLSSRAIAHRALRPLSQLTGRISTIAPGSGERIALDSGIAELDTFAARFDDLVVRFEDALARERRLTAQASHELRTPLTIARAEIEALSSAADAPLARERALAAVDRLAQLVEILLWFARAQARLDDEKMDVVNLADVVRAQVAERVRAEPLFLARCDLPDEVLVRGDERLLGRVAANLLDNAVKHGEGSGIELRAELDAGRVRLTISNRGLLAGDLSERVFEPFYRGPHAASVPGFGLGLPFARAVARAHGGDLAVGASSVGHTALVLSLPVLAWSDSAAGESSSVVQRRFSIDCYIEQTPR